MSQSSPEGIILSKGSTLVSAELSINEEKVLKMSQEESTSCACGANTSCQCGPEEHKQETLEEVAERLATNYCSRSTENWHSFKLGFIECAKWQQEQDKNKFSEEDMINRTQVVFELTNKGYSIDEIIEQFKKK
jgi:hypothetical protein